MARRKAKDTGKRRKAGGRSPAKKQGKAATVKRPGGAGAKGASRSRPAKRSGGGRPARGNRTPPEMKDEETGSVREVSLESLEAVEEAGESSESQRARRQADAMAGDEEPGGTVEVPDNDNVDRWAAAFGVERSPESPLRASADVLADRDRRRGGSHPPPKV